MSLSPHCPRRQRPVFSRSLGNPNGTVHCQFGLDRGASVASLPEAVQKPVTLGERVRAARHALGMSQAQLAGDELTKGFISQVEAGLVRPSLRSLQIIASRLGRRLDYFIRDESPAGAEGRGVPRPPAPGPVRTPRGGCGPPGAPAAPRLPA